ncbi:iron uptake transporter permease EfeU [Gordonia sp. CPCC 205515]|uniref:iron uptake transporter permease EfeU n=1 Tax=Gordonia sp. CPCC 205515 TaxID=3140791 RepID=UPI003AF3523C
MFATFIIGLREGLEAALIVGIIAAFLNKQGQTRALKWMWFGVVIAIAICVAVGVGLEVLARDLPQKQQEGLETVIGVIAVVMVTYMIVWMRQHSRDLKGELEQAASGAVASGSAIAFVSMAFLAVLREGLETSVFLNAAFNASHNTLPAVLGALLGIGVSVLLGYGIYRGGVHINLARFFKVTGMLLVFVAAGLVMTALHTAHEAGWLDAGQQQVADLTWLVQPGTLRSSLLTGVLGLQPKPVLIEVVGWVLYVVIVGSIVLWPAGKPFPRRAVGALAGGFAAASLVAAALVFFTAPAAPSAPPATVSATPGPSSTSGILSGLTPVTPRDVTVTIASVTDSTATGTLRTIVGDAPAVDTNLPKLQHVDSDDAAPVARYQQLASPDIPGSALVPGAPERVTVAQIVAGNRGRLPVGLNTQTFGASAPVIYAVTTTVTPSIDTTFGRPIAATVNYVMTATVTPDRGTAVVLGKVATFATGAEPTAAELTAATDRATAADRHHRNGVVWPSVLLVLGIVLAAVAAAMLLGRRRPDDDGRADDSPKKTSGESVPGAESGNPRDEAPQKKESTRP